MTARRAGRASLLVAPLLSLASLPAAAQVAQSANFQVLDFCLDGGGGGAASLAFSGHVSLNAPSGAESASPNYRVALGFLQGSDPQPTNAPVVFGLSVDCAPIFGGTPLTITGLNFDKFGAANTVTVTVGGAPATAVQVASDTLLSCLTPPGSPGPASVVVSSSFGSAVVGTFEYTPNLSVYGTGTPSCNGLHHIGANLCPKIDTPGFQITCDNAPPNALGLGLVTDASDPGTDVFGIGVLFHVGFFNATPTEIYNFDFFSDAQGVAFASVPLPNNPNAVGLTYYAQAFWYWGLPCGAAPLGLSSSNGLQITIEN